MFSRCLWRQAPGARRACIQPRQWAGRRAGRAVGLWQDHAAAHRRGARPRFRRRRCAPRAWHARHGLPGAALAAVADGRAERAACSPARDRHRARHVVPDARPQGPPQSLSRRAFAVEPDLLLLDEPFVSLDDALAARLREELAELVNRRPVTTLLVTHNVDEAVGLADRLLLLSVNPARILADVAVARPRAPHTTAELADLREEIARRLNQAFL